MHSLGVCQLFGVVALPARAAARTACSQCFAIHGQKKQQGLHPGICYGRFCASFEFIRNPAGLKSGKLLSSKAHGLLWKSRRLSPGLLNGDALHPRLHKSGRARAIGASNYSVDHLEADSCVPLTFAGP